MTGQTECSGERLTTSKRLGAGAEATVYAVKGRSDRAIKVFEQGADLEKWRDMIAWGRPVEGAAMPIDIWTMRGKAKGMGLVLPLVSGANQLHTLYNPALRRVHFPKACPNILRRTAENLARTIAQLHTTGMVIGDLNPTNVLVQPDGTVHLIDLDSAQITTPQKTHPCHLGQPLYTAPEWQNRSLRGAFRTVHADHFALAVLVYHLLLDGRHPFSGVWTGQGEPPTVETAIAEGWYVHGTGKLQPPPAALEPSVWGHEVLDAFQRAFQADPLSRPSAAEWNQILARAKRQTAPPDPICIPPFPSLPERFHETPSHLEIPPPFETICPAPRRSEFPAFQQTCVQFLLDIFRPRSEIKTRVAAAEEAWQNALDNWIAQRDDWNLHRDQLLQQKHGQSRMSTTDKHLKARWLFYKNLHSAPRAHHESNLHLERFRLHPGAIPGIGPTAIQQLNEAGIATAFDLFPDLLRTVKGIGPERRRALMNWRKTCSLNVPVQRPDPTHYIAIRNRHISSLLKSTK